MSFRQTCILLAAAIVALTRPVAARQTFTVHSDAELLAMPEGILVDELNRIRPPGLHLHPAVPDPDANRHSVFEASTKADLIELDLALADLKVEPERRADLVEQYQAVRKEIGRRLADPKRSPETDIAFPIPVGIPEEFSDYLRGLLWDHDGRTDDARAMWRKITALPADARRYRGPWALYMLGRSYLDTDPAKAIDYFQKTREAIGDGPDRLSLASSSLGWEGRAALNQGRYCDAANLYLQQAWTGDPSGVASLQHCLRALLHQTGPIREQLLNDPRLRRAMTAFVLCDGGPFCEITNEDSAEFAPWLNDVRQHGTADPDEIDRLAWTAWRQNNLEAARKWAGRGRSNSPVNRLIRAKLALHEKDVETAITLLESVRNFNADLPGPMRSVLEMAEGPQLPMLRAVATADLEAICLARGQYTQSLSMLIDDDGGHSTYDDVYYIADRLLTVDELRSYVDHLPPAERDRMCLFAAWRLARAAAFDQAMPYYSPDVREKMTRYVRGLADGHDGSQPPRKRAEALMAAAVIIKTDGEALFGTPFATAGSTYENRLRGVDDIDADGGDRPVTAPSADEIKRVNATAPPAVRPDEFRHRAAALAWEAAALLPDNTTEKVDALYTGGSWLKARDPKAADRFYKAICKHCAGTDLGQRCAKARWFAPRQ
jgi:tetratricopeptide (TPR) repeat protein